MATRRRGARSRWLPFVLGLPGCVGFQLQSSGSDEGSFTALAEDGSRYVSVEGGSMSNKESLARRWKKTAHEACDGDYIVLSDAGFERRSRGVVQRRVHEGFVQCVAPADDVDESAG